MEGGREGGWRMRTAGRTGVGWDSSCSRRWIDSKAAAKRPTLLCVFFNPPSYQSHLPPLLSQLSATFRAKPPKSPPSLLLFLLLFQPSRHVRTSPRLSFLPTPLSPSSPPLTPFFILPFMPSRKILATGSSALAVSPRGKLNLGVFFLSLSLFFVSLFPQLKLHPSYFFYNGTRRSFKEWIFSSETGNENSSRLSRIFNLGNFCLEEFGG